MIQWLSVWYCTFCFLVWNARCSASDGKRNWHFNAMVLLVRLVRPWASWSPINGAVEEPFKLYTYDLNDLALEDLCGFFLLDALSCSKATELVPSCAFFFGISTTQPGAIMSYLFRWKGTSLLKLSKEPSNAPWTFLETPAGWTGTTSSSGARRWVELILTYHIRAIRHGSLTALQL